MKSQKIKAILSDMLLIQAIITHQEILCCVIKKIRTKFFPYELCDLAYPGDLLWESWVLHNLESTIQKWNVIIIINTFTTSALQFFIDHPPLIKSTKMFGDIRKEIELSRQVLSVCWWAPGFSSRLFSPN